MSQDPSIYKTKPFWYHTSAMATGLITWALTILIIIAYTEQPYHPYYGQIQGRNRTFIILVCASISLISSIVAFSLLLSRKSDAKALRTKTWSIWIATAFIVITALIFLYALVAIGYEVLTEKAQHGRPKCPDDFIEEYCKSKEYIRNLHIAATVFAIVAAVLSIISTFLLSKGPRSIGDIGVMGTNANAVGMSNDTLMFGQQQMAGYGGAPMMTTTTTYQQPMMMAAPMMAAPMVMTTPMVARPPMMMI